MYPIRIFIYLYSNMATLRNFSFSTNAAPFYPAGYIEQEVSENDLEIRFRTPPASPNKGQRSSPGKPMSQIFKENAPFSGDENDLENRFRTPPVSPAKSRSAPRTPFSPLRNSNSPSNIRANAADNDQEYSPKTRQSSQLPILTPFGLPVPTLIRKGNLLNNNLNLFYETPDCATEAEESHTPLYKRFPAKGRPTSLDEQENEFEPLANPISPKTPVSKTLLKAAFATPATPLPLPEPDDDDLMSFLNAFLQEQAKAMNEEIVQAKKEESEAIVSEESLTPLRTPAKPLEQTQAQIQPAIKIKVVAPVIPVDPLPGVKFPFTKAFRVSRWDNTTLQVPLSQADFPEYQNSGLTYQQTMIILHGFSLIADRFYSIGLRNERNNQNGPIKQIEHLVVAEMSLGKTNRLRGVVEWVVDTNDICFHKFFHKDDSRDFVKDFIRDTFLKVDFPSLGGSSKSANQKNKEIVTADGEKVSIHPVSKTVSIANPRLNVLLTLYNNVYS